MEIHDGELMSPGDAAKVLGVCAPMVVKLARLGRLPVAARTVGGWRLFWTRDVRQLAAARQRARSGRARARGRAR